jgi:hypothetical protein
MRPLPFVIRHSSFVVHFASELSFFRSNFMKVFSLLILFFPLTVMCQLNLPKPENIERIEISSESMKNWYEPDELIRLLPKFGASTGTYGTKAIPFQYGKFILKNKREITWMANHTDSILLYDGRQEQLFVLPQKDEPLFLIWDRDGKEGFINAEGKIVQKPKHNAVREFSEGLAPVLVGDKWGYVNRKNEMVIAPRWKALSQGWLPAVGSFSEGLAPVIEQVHWDVIDDSNYYSYKCGYINLKGEYVIEPKFRQDCGSFSDGLARIAVDLQGDEYEKGEGWLGFIDKKGDWVIKPQFFEAGNFAEGFALVQSEPTPQDLYVKIPPTGLVRNNYARKSLYLIDKKGKRNEGLKDCRWRYSFREGLTIVYDQNFEPSFINEQCEEVFRLPSDVQIDTVRFFSEGLLLVKKEIKGQKMFGYLDRSGKVAIDFKFVEADYFSDGLAGVVIKEGDETYNAYINRTGEIVLKNTRSNAPFKNGLAFHYLYTWTISERPNARNIYGYMNKQGKYVWLSPRAENYLDKDWIKENYVGAKLNF